MTDKNPSKGHDGAYDEPTTAQTVAAFAPGGSSSSHNRSQSSILIHQKSPLLVATPPQVTRALAYSHPFILPFNHLVGLLSWTTGDPWESFLLVAGFWFTVLYGDVILRYAGPLVLVAGLILGMYTRRYSPLSSTTWSGQKQAKHKRTNSDKHRKSLDEILDSLQTFTSRCDILIDPLLRLTDFLSTQQTATSATTRPALTALFIRILFFTPVWIMLSLPPLQILTAQRVILFLGTLILSWHSRPARVSRTILWRSRTIRNLCTMLTGLTFTGPPPAATESKTPPGLPPRADAATVAAKKGSSPGVRFTFIIYENQRRWLGLGWTANMLAYERASWSDEHLNSSASPPDFKLPETDVETTKWKWTRGGEWQVEGALTEKEKSARRIGGGGGGEESGWVYYDNKWRDGRRSDGWGRYTRRRKWVRDAELVEVTSSDSSTAPTPKASKPASEADTEATLIAENVDGAGTDAAAKRKGWFGSAKARPKSSAGSSGASGSGSGVSARSREEPEDDVHTPIRFRERERDWNVGEGLAPDLG